LHHVISKRLPVNDDVCIQGVDGFGGQALSGTTTTGVDKYLTEDVKSTSTIYKLFWGVTITNPRGEHKSCKLDQVKWT
jgi:hypothetical protein